MPKKLIAKKDLELIILQELRALPGCDSITTVSVSRIDDTRFETNWSVVALTANGKQPDAVKYATEVTQDKLRDIYNLFADRRAKLP